jgi:hypothetical protein
VMDAEARRAPPTHDAARRLCLARSGRRPGVGTRERWASCLYRSNFDQIVTVPDLLDPAPFACIEVRICQRSDFLYTGVQQIAPATLSSAPFPASCGATSERHVLVPSPRPPTRPWPLPFPPNPRRSPSVLLRDPTRNGGSVRPSEKPLGRWRMPPNDSRWRERMWRGRTNRSMRSNR